MLGSGAGGLVEIKAPAITLGQDSEVNISAISGTGDAGVLTIAGTSITAVNADIKGETFGEGKAADIALTADDIALTGTLINSSTESVGAGGFIALTADTISIDDGSAIESDSFSSGDGGENYFKRHPFVYSNERAHRGRGARQRRWWSSGNQGACNNAWAG